MATVDDVRKLELELETNGFVRSVEERAQGQFYMTVEPEDVVEACRHVLENLDGRYVVTIGADEREDRGDFAVSHVFALDEEHVFMTVQVRLEPGDPQLASITGIIPGASWAERETQDLLGITFNNLDDDRRLVLPDDWPEDLYPLRSDVAHDIDPEPVEGVAPERRDPPEDAENATVVGLGPFYPTLEEPEYFRLFVDGETIVGCDYRGFYNHRGIEKIGATALTYTQVPFIAERICGICGFIHSSCYCEALENA
ncbi:MAG: NADH-quinone oxidoreductase subunit C, partial [Armatimonadota bacterium]